MLQSEDYAHGFNLTSEQRDFAAEFTRDGAHQLRAARTHRRLLTLGLMPLATALPARGRQQVVNLGTELFVSGLELAMITLSDHPARYPNQWHQIESRVLVSLGHFDSAGAFCVGGAADSCRLRVDFSKGPLRRGQEGDKVTGSGVLVSPIAGKLRVARCGKYLDFCVGEVKRNPTIVFRIQVDDFAGDNPAARELGCTLPDNLPDPGETLEFGEVAIGTPLVELSQTCTYFAAKFTPKGEPLTQWPPGRILPASRVELFRVLLDMHRFQNDCVLLPPNSRPGLLAPENWLPSVYVAFKDDVVTDGDSAPVTVNPATIFSLPGYTHSRALMEDFREAVGPRGKLKLVSDYSGVVTAIEPVPGSTNLVTIQVGNETMTVPAVADLYVFNAEGEKKPLEVGMTIVENQEIGDICPRVSYTLETLQTVLAGCLNGLLDDFLFRSGIWPGEQGWDGEGVLYDARYVASVIPKYCSKRPKPSAKPGEVIQGEFVPDWYWDIRRAGSFYDSDRDAIIYPPVSYPDWEQLQVQIGSLTLDLNDPFSPEKVDAKGHTLRPTVVKMDSNRPARPARPARAAA